MNEELLNITVETSNECRYYTSKELLDKHNILVGFTQRVGGISAKPFNDLNLAFHVGDDLEKVKSNREILTKALNIDINRLTCAEQVHGSDVATVNETMAGRGAFSLEHSIKGVDALITATANIPLALFFADCVPVVIVEPKEKVVAVVHAGWRGIYGDIVGRVVSSMKENNRINVERCIAFVGPSIKGCCFEVGDDILGRFSEKFSADNFKVSESESYGSWRKAGNRIDLQELARMQLVACGIDNDRIAIIDHCTACHNDELFSYRAGSGKTGRHAAIVNIY